MSNNTGGPAFPTTQYANGVSPSGHDNGMTLRDYFAAKAMQGMFANSNLLIGGLFREENFEMAYKAADAMLKAREA